MDFLVSDSKKALSPTSHSSFPLKANEVHPTRRGVFINKRYIYIYYTKKIEYVCLYVCLSFIGGQTVGWNEMKLGMSDPWDMRMDIGRSSSRSKVTGSRGQGVKGSRSPGNFNFSISSDRDGTNAIRQIIKIK